MPLWLTFAPDPSLIEASLILRIDDKAILSTVLSAKARDAVVICDQRTGEFDRGRNQEAVGQVAMFEMMKLVGASGRVDGKGGRLDTGPPEEAFHPAIDRKIEIDPSAINEQRDFPGGDRAQKNRAAIAPAIVDQCTRRLA